MPLKIRELKSQLRRVGFDDRPGKGSHTVWRHPLLPQLKITLAGNDGNDAIRDLKEAKGEKRTSS